MLKDYLDFSIRNLKHRKLRTGLTVIGIIIGIASIIALISISQGLENAIVEQFEKMGSNRVYATPKGFQGQGAFEGLTNDDNEQIEKMPEVDWVNPYLMFSKEVEFGKEKEFINQIIGIETKDLEQKWSDMDLNMEAGSLPKNGQRGIAVIGYSLANDMFKNKIHLKNKIKIKDHEFEVIGIVEKIGNEADDNSVWLAMEDAREVSGKENEVNMIEIKIKPGIDINLAAEKISKRLERYRGDDNFELMTPEQILDQIGQLLGIIQLVLGGIAAISLVVGGVGIMNSMYTSVLQRRKEIGILKSVGAKNSDIVMLFLVEAGIIGLGGGIIGVALGALIAFATGSIAEQLGFGLLSIKVNWLLYLFGLLFAIGVGMFAGALPARKAAKLRPAEALRS